MYELDVGIYAKLTADDTLMGLINGVYHDVAPGTASWPVVLFRQESGFEEVSLGGRVAKNLTYQIKAVDQSQSVNLAQQIDNRVRIVLDRQTLTISGWRTIQIKRETDVNYREVEKDGTMYQYIGGMYNIMIAPSS